VAIATSSSDQKKLLAEKGVKQPKFTSGMNRLPTQPLTPQDSDERSNSRKSKKERDKELAEDAKLIGAAKKRFIAARKVEETNRKEGVEDLKFLNNEQWSQSDASARAADGRPCITENRLPTFANQITNDQRQNRPSINISPMGDKSSKKSAKTARGMIRAIERDSDADVAYDTGFQSAVHNGWGYWRVMTEYESDESMDKVLCIGSLPNPMNVYLDPGRTPFKLDAKWGFISEMLPKEEFEREYPDASMTPWGETGVGDSDKEWITTDEIRVAEYYYFDYDERELVQLDNGHQGWEDELADEINSQIASGKLEIISRRTVHTKKLKWCKITAIEVLERGDCDGQYIPIIECDGTVLNINGKVTKKGIVRDAKGPQRMLNYYSPLSLDTPVPTPAGWTTIGQVKQGDIVFDECGKQTSVIGLSPIYINRKCYRISFDDGSQIIADGEHKWSVMEQGKRTAKGTPRHTKIVRTDDLSPSKHVIRASQALDMPDIDLPIHPYLLGVWLGDGSRYEPNICAGEDDIHAIRKTLEDVGCKLGGIRRSGDKVPLFTVLGVRSKFVEMGLLKNKHIPSIYMRASKRQREMLVQGLMDTDGNIHKKNRQCTFVNTDSNIYEPFMELLHSLGITAHSCIQAGKARKFPNGMTYECQESTHVYFTAGVEHQIFRLPRKLEMQQQDRKQHPYRTKVFRIRKVEEVPSVPVRCLAVDTPTHLFLVGKSMIPTHNTLETENVALQPKAPWIMEEGQIEGHEAEWKLANKKSFAYLTYKGTNIAGKPAPPPQRQPFAGPPAAILSAKQGTIEALRAVTGIRFDATMSERMQDESGRAIRELNRNANLGAYHYIDNFGRALKNTGIVLMDLIPKTYDTKRIVAILDETGSEDRVMINPFMSQAHGESLGTTPESNQPSKIKMFNPKIGRYQVTVTIGPSYATKRIEASESQLDFMKVVPGVAPLIADIVAKNSDWDGAEEIAARIARTQDPKLLQPTRDDMTPQIQALIQGLQGQLQQQSVQMQQLVKELNDRQKDRDVVLTQIEKKHEADLVKVASTFETKMEEIAAKRDATLQGTIGRQLADVAKAVKAFDQIGKQGTEKSGSRSHPDHPGFTIENA